MTIDVKWFQDRLRDLGVSQRQASMTFTKNHNTVALILKGKRGVAHDEIPVIASLLNTTNEEVLKRLGVETPAGTKSDTVDVVGSFDETGAVSERRATRVVPAPVGAGPHTRAVLFDSLTGGFGHGNAYYFDEVAKDRPVDAATLNAICVVSIGDKTGRHVGVVTRGLEAGKYDVVNVATHDKIVSGVSIRSALPVTWIKI